MVFIFSLFYFFHWGVLDVNLNAITDNLWFVHFSLWFVVYDKRRIHYQKVYISPSAIEPDKHSKVNKLFGKFNFIAIIHLLLFSQLKPNAIKIHSVINRQK